MFDTYTTIVGTVLNNPEKRATAKTNTLVATFRVATHPRHFDQKSGQWVDGTGLRIRVNCWRKLAENVANSVTSGDPVIIHGRISTRDWKTQEGEPRLGYEVDAVSVGHDLSRGTTKFIKSKPEPTGLVVEDADAESRVNGELTYSLADAAGTESSLDEFASLAPPGSEEDALSILRAAGMGATFATDSDDESEDDNDEEEPRAADSSGGSGGRSRRRGRQPVPA
jgi:single-strand DNA-binding protein